MKFFFSKSKLANTGMVIARSLTKRRLVILKEAQNKFGIKNTWTTKGNIYASIDGEKHLIKIFDDIYDLTIE